MRTLEELQKLTNLQLRVICAELNGWEEIVQASLDCWEGKPPIGHDLRDLGHMQIPNYTNDADAISEFRQHLISATEQSCYARFIWIQLGRKELPEINYFGYEDLWHFLKANPRHHTIAFILAKQ